MTASTLVVAFATWMAGAGAIALVVRFADLSGRHPGPPATVDLWVGVAFYALVAVAAGATFSATIERAALTLHATVLTAAMGLAFWAYANHNPTGEESPNSPFQLTLLLLFVCSLGLCWLLGASLLRWIRQGGTRSVVLVGLLVATSLAAALVVRAGYEDRQLESVVERAAYIVPRLGAPVTVEHRRDGTLLWRYQVHAPNLSDPHEIAVAASTYGPNIHVTDRGFVLTDGNVTATVTVTAEPATGVSTIEIIGEFHG